MKKLLTFLTTICLTTSVLAQVQVFTLEHNTGTTIYDNLDSAIINAQNGDVIYLPGGSIALGTEIRKSIALIGAGCHGDSTSATGPTIMVDELKLRKGANNLFITGIAFKDDATLDSCNNIIFERCNIESEFGMHACTTVVYKECIILNEINDTYSWPGLISSGIIFRNCIITYPPTDIKGVLLENNIIFNAGIQYSSSRYLLYDLDQMIARNNILCFKKYHSGLNQLEKNNSSWYNNIFCDSIDVPSSNITFSSNKIDISLQSIFQNIVDSVNYSTANNLHLKAGSPALNAGTGGTDCGIYGGTEPYKEGGVPLNPHIQSAVISSSTNQKGELDINIKVRAQNR